MNVKDNALAVLRREEPERVPLLVNEIPLGAFERELRNMGVGVCLQRNEYWLEEQYVTVEERNNRGYTEIIYRTQLGAVSRRVQTQSTEAREADELQHEIKTQIEYMIKTEADYDVVTYIIENTIVHFDDSHYLWAVRDMGEDGIVIGSRIETPYEAVMKYFGREKWISEQSDHPHEFEKLLRAYEKKTQEICEVVADSPSEIVLIGSIRERYDPEQFRKYCLPHFKKYAHIMHQKGKIVGARVPSQSLNTIASLVSETNLDFTEFFQPPPTGDLSLAGARKAWGDETVIWMKFPEKMFHCEASETYRYTSNLILRGAPRDRLMIGLIDLDAADQNNRDTLSKAVLSIINAISDVGVFPDKSDRSCQNNVEGRL